ncbi:3-methyl-2-oxobutanoate hydroxymethyltransferase [Salipaludibacillus sp. LMS25]|jgi:3-methyl-2-oxobutanoate hydroxymethyltransferase|uniref:3-methyl-2-oxobutanoate hydroxymethyltransferase n=1 Tax=Salipaludibacillus sp. LMS25 TaxID=2924031 RepID=UPI0020D0319E|nr:3-methyl-2-oxobutanoate hydroxymethyltransferase [Salipaludibacillus sp. LMS25]UTR14660.1 3-methyl-2-oxobutanoate hydroxymethyltransferase [Salipaludibacillus sp. LMS25]
MKTTKDFKKMKKDGEPIVMVTAYDAPAAGIAETADVDCLLVGDSLGMVVLGYESTVPVTLDDMVHHTKAVKRGARETFVITDMPFLTYHSSRSETVNNARRLVQEAGAHAIKLEGNGDVITYTKHLVDAGVPVVNHLGLTPQSVGVFGGYHVQGKQESDAERLKDDAIKTEEAGACMLVLECVPESLAQQISQLLTIPVIGIGAGRFTDGQVLVYHDIIGYNDGHVPKFVKQYANINETAKNAITQFSSDVKKRHFPEHVHVFQPLEKTVSHLYGKGDTT